VILSFLAMAALQAASPEEPADARYRACAGQIATNAEAALAAATAWRDQGGGLHARQCLALALVALERWAPAATAFEQAAREAETAQDPRRADFWVQAGNAWIAAEEPARALQAFDAALLAPGLTDELRGEVHLDRARAQVGLGNPAAARAEIDRALQLVPSDPMAWYLSASLARRENNLSRAGSEIARARELAPDNPDILLYAGTLAGLAGNMEEAERLYRRVAEAAPQSEAGRRAAASLATLTETEVEAPAPSGQAPAPDRAPAAAPPQAPQPVPPRQSR
jgi:tetratricopeptide (TPR) repeat protein